MSKRTFWILYPAAVLVGFGAIFIPLSFWLASFMGYWASVISIPAGWTYGIAILVLGALIWDAKVR